MKIIILITFFILITLFINITTTNSYAKTLPMKDLRGETLTQGNFTVRGSSDLSVEDYVNLLLYQNTTIIIDKNGKVSGTGKSFFTNMKWFPNYSFTGDASFTMSGNYDEKEHRFTGTFSVQHHNSSDDLVKDSPIKGSYTMNYSGKFVGGQSAETGSVVFDFSGNKSYVGITTRMDGTIEDTSRSEAWRHRVIFGDFIQRGKIVSGLVRGTAQLSRGKDNWIDINKETVTSLHVNDTIKTGPNTRFLIKYKDGSTFILKSNSELTILANGVSLKYGDSTYFLFKEGKQFKVKTPTTVLGVLGTIFNVSYSPDTEQSTVELMKGSVVLNSLDDNKLISVLKPGEKIEISKTDYRKNTFDYNSKLSTIENELKKDEISLNLKITEEKINDSEHLTQSNKNIVTKFHIWQLIIAVIIVGVGGGIFIFKKYLSP